MEKNVKRALEVIDKIQENYMGMNKSYQRVKFVHLREVINSLDEQYSEKSQPHTVDDNKLWCKDCDGYTINCIHKPLLAKHHKSNESWNTIENLKATIESMCYSEELARREALKILTEYEVRGDSYGVPMLVNIIELLNEKIKSNDLVALDEEKLFDFIIRLPRNISNKDLVKCILSKFGQKK